MHTILLKKVLFSKQTHKEMRANKEKTHYLYLSIFFDAKQEEAFVI